MLPSAVVLAEGATENYGKIYQHHVHPEGWEEKKASHIPTLILKGDVAYVHVDHVQTEEHYINAIYVRADIHGRSAQTIFFKEFTPESPKAVARFAVSCCRISVGTINRSLPMLIVLLSSSCRSLMG